MRTNWEWEQFGEDIRRTVQDAVDSRDFRRLNQTITDTVNSAFHEFTDGMRNPRGGYQYQKADYGTGRQKDRTKGAWQNLDLNQLKRPTLYAGTRAKKAAGLTMTITGYTIAGCLLIGGMITGVTGMLLGAGVGVSVALSIQVILLAVFTALGITGTKLLSRVKRFQTYIEELQGREYGNVKDLALRVQKKEKFVVKDLETMIRKGWFLQGHLDEQKACLMTSREAFEQYQELMAQARQQKAREQETKERQKADADRRAGLDPKVQEVIEAGNAYIRKIRECNDAIPGEVVSEKMSRMELLTKRIFARVEQNPEVVTDIRRLMEYEKMSRMELLTKRIFARVEQNPEVVTDIRRLMEYYLPTAVKLLEAYEELDAQPVQGENILSSKKEIEDTLDTLNIAFEKLLDDLFQETAWDVSSDISVLKTMLAQEGLTKNDFSTGGK